MPFGGTPWLSDRISVWLGLNPLPFSAGHPCVSLCVFFVSWGHIRRHTLFYCRTRSWLSTEPFEWTWNWLWPMWLLLLFSVKNKHNNYECVLSGDVLAPVMARKLPLFFASIFVNFNVRRHRKKIKASKIIKVSSEITKRVWLTWIQLFCKYWMYPQLIVKMC